MTDEKAPATFDEDSFIESAAYISIYAEKFGTFEKGIKQLAHVAGGSKLESALDPYSFPPCGSSTDCVGCWVRTFCEHKITSEEERKDLILIENAITDPNRKIPVAIFSAMQTANKVDPYIVQTILSMKEEILTGNFGIESWGTNDPTTKDSGTNSVDGQSRSVPRDLDEMGNSEPT